MAASDYETCVGPVAAMERIGACTRAVAAGLSGKQLIDARTARGVAYGNLGQLDNAIIDFTASDNLGVTGYMLTESSSSPSSGSNWYSTVPTTYTFSSEGQKTLYAWVKDAAGNISVSGRSRLRRRAGLLHERATE